MQELCKFDFKIHAIPNGLEKYMIFNINNKLLFVNNFQFLSSTLDNLVKNLGKDDFKYLSQGFDCKVLDLVKQKRFYPFEYMSGFRKFKKNCQAKKSSLRGKKIEIKSMSMS